MSTLLILEKHNLTRAGRWAENNNEIGSFSLFYNIVNLFILTFLYIYRNEMKVNYHLYWSFALLFLMGMEIRSIQTIGLGLN